MKKKLLSLLTFSLAFAMLSGCWSSREINELAFVMGVAIDVGEDENDFEITLQIANPGAKNGSGEGSAGEGESSTVFVNFSETGPGIEMPISAISLQCDRKLYTGHNQVIVISRAAAERGISPIIDFFTRSTDGRLTVSLFIAEGAAKDVLSVSGILEPLPSMYLKSLEASQLSFGERSEASMMSFVSAMLSPTAAAIVPIVHIFEDESGMRKLSLSGAAAFYDGRLCMTLSPDMLKSVLSIKDKSVENFFRLHTPDGAATLNISTSSVALSAQFFEDGTLDKISVNLRYGCTIAETNISSDVLSQKTRASLAQAASEYISAQAQDTFEYTQFFGADVYGFGEYLYRNHPKKAKSLLESWRAAYPELNVEFNVSVEILSSGSITQPLAPGGYPQNQPSLQRKQVSEK